MGNKHKKKKYAKNQMKETIYTQEKDFKKSLWKSRNRIRKLVVELNEVRKENSKLRKEIKKLNTNGGKNGNKES